MIRPMILTASTALMFTLGTPGMSVAQDVVPGGWSDDVVHQSLGPLITVPNIWGTPAVAYSPYGVYRPSPPPAYPSFAEPPGAVNGLFPLGEAIRRSKTPRQKKSR